jgi:hypothetical protein
MKTFLHCTVGKKEIEDAEGDLTLIHCSQANRDAVSQSLQTFPHIPKNDMEVCIMRNNRQMQVEHQVRNNNSESSV